jgi:mevalonate kinase
MGNVVGPSFSASAGGKVILLGEHAVVYGSAAIAVGLDQGAHAEVREAPVSELVLGEERYVLGLEPDGAPAARAFAALLGSLGTGGIAAEARLEIPAGAGLGASASLGVALARAIRELLLRSTGRAPALAPAALAWENVFHGNASGVDTAAAEHGGCLAFRRGTEPSVLRPGRPLELVVALVEPGASTRRMVEGVAARRAAERARIDNLLDSIAALVERARACIALGDNAQLGQLMSENHQRLVALGVSTPQLDQACRWALEAGALGAKLTGAGGGGCAVALVEAERRAAVLEAWTGRALPCWEKRSQ